MKNVEGADQSDHSSPNGAPSAIAHNTVLNLFGLGLPLIVAFFVMPIALHALGAVRFGLLGLAWVATEYLVLFDLGMGRATIRFVAEAHSRGDERIGEIATTSVMTQVGTGLLGGLTFAAITPFVVRHIFHVSAPQQPEAIAMFRVVAVSLPVVLLLSTLRGILEGVQRFDMSNAVKVATSALAVIIPAIGGVAGLSLATIMMFVLVSRLTGCLLLEHLIRRAIPRFRWVMPTDRPHLKKMLFFGGWVSVSSAVSPVLVSFDRFALASVTGLAAVGYYTAPYEGVSRLLLIPVSFIGTLLPALTREIAVGSRERAAELVSASTRHLMLLIAPPLAIIITLSPAILSLWLGPEAAAQSATALRILAFGVFINAVAHPSYVSLYALGRPDLPAKFHLLELCIHLPLTWILVSRYGAIGAATGWTVRVALDCSLIMIFARRHGVAEGPESVGRMKTAISIVGVLYLVALLIGLILLPRERSIAVTVLGLAVLSFLLIGWRNALEPAEQATALRMSRWYLRGLRGDTAI